MSWAVQAELTGRAASPGCFDDGLQLVSAKPA
jgi:hypothetical protein